MAIEPNLIKRRTPLIEATLAHRLDLMLTYSLDSLMLNKSDVRGNTALHYAVEQGFLKGVKLLLNQGCILNVFNKAVLTPLMLALKKHHISIAETLIIRGASPYILNSKLESALNIAIGMRQYDVIELMLIEDTTPEVKLPSLYVACATAAKYDRIECIDPLVRAGADLNYPFFDVDPPLNVSVQRNNIEMVKAWLKHEPPIEKYDLGGYTPLMRAAYAGNLEICIVLIAHGALVNTIGADGKNTAYSVAVTRRQEKCARYLSSYNNYQILNASPILKE